MENIFGGALNNFFSKLGDFGGEGLDSLADFYLTYRGMLGFFGLVLSLVFFGLAIYYIVRLNIFGFKATYYFELASQKKLSRGHSIRAWRKIKKRLATGRQEEMKLAIIEADRILAELLKISGYSGKNTQEKLKDITPAQLSNIESLREAHQFSRRVLSEPDLKITYQEALENLKIYAETFQKFELIT